MKVCSRCKNTLQDNEAFCSRCGCREFTQLQGNGQGQQMRPQQGQRPMGMNQGQGQNQQMNMNQGQGQQMRPQQGQRPMGMNQGQGQNQRPMGMNQGQQQVNGYNQQQQMGGYNNQQQNGYNNQQMGGFDQGFDQQNGFEDAFDEQQQQPKKGKLGLGKKNKGQQNNQMQQQNQYDQSFDNNFIAQQPMVGDDGSSVKDWIFTLITLAVPILNLIILFKALVKKESLTGNQLPRYKVNFYKAQLIFLVICFVLSFVATLTLSASLASVLGGLG